MNDKVEQFIKANRKTCWESDYENGEYCIGENKVRQFLESIPMQAVVKPDACGGWQKEKPNKPCYFIHRYNRKDNKPSLFEAVIDGGVLVVANIQDDEFVETMEDFADGDFFIIEKY